MNKPLNIPRLLLSFLLIFYISANGNPKAHPIPAFPDFPEAAESLDEGSSDRIYFESSSPVDFLTLLRRESLSTTVTAGSLTIPKKAAVTKPAPAMVILHGSSGIREEREEAYAKELAKDGFATFVVDSFGSRGVTQKTPYELSVLAVTEADLVADAYAALRILQTHPVIDPQRIGVMGFSYGGMASRFALDERIFLALTTDEFPFAVHIDFYGPCFLDLGTVKTTGAPLLSLRGELDASNSLIDCASIENTLRQAGSSVATKVFAEAGHGWELPFPQTLVQTLNPVSCHVSMDTDGKLRFDERVFAPDSGTSREERIAVRADLLRRLIETCMQDGYIMGRNERADEEARGAVRKFIETSRAHQALSRHD